MKKLALDASLTSSQKNSQSQQLIGFFAFASICSNCCVFYSSTYSYYSSSDLYTSPSRIKMLSLLLSTLTVLSISPLVAAESCGHYELSPHIRLLDHVLDLPSSAVGLQVGCFSVSWSGTVSETRNIFLHSRFSGTGWVSERNGGRSTLRWVHFRVIVSSCTIHHLCKVVLVATTSEEKTRPRIPFLVP